ncbi:uracil-DNA glycosylase family protein [Streptococcus sp.]|uniref:uracil-DNA glycosylase family protein n=1 Tax=Streptococcus sp. TaxID=1306 RepID=UPI001CB4A446|nr:uracil-DNA glycosylase family protein [Streptococcus sp.]MBF1722463.1 uracil-DNA glycosylase family protein [Streptococcus sp.]
MQTIEDIAKTIMADSENQEFTEQGIKPLFAAPKNAQINIVGQAPGLKTQQAGLYWKDKSGDRLREWLGVDEETFYHSGYFAVLPMDFYFKGHGKSGDLPPRKGFAERWHQPILELLPDIELTILIGQYAQKYYLHQKGNIKLTETVQHYQDYLPDFFPLVHPSPRNQIWMAKNPWFEAEVVPELQALVQKIIHQ